MLNDMLVRLMIHDDNDWIVAKPSALVQIDLRYKSFKTVNEQARNTTRINVQQYKTKSKTR